MHLLETPLEGAYLIALEKNEDNRGSFSRLFCEKFFSDNKLPDHRFVQVNLSFNKNMGTLRGMHFQKSPYDEAKVVYCLQGKIFDVLIDLRKNSSTYKKSFGITLEREKNIALFIPKGLAHGFVTLESNTELLYLMSEFYHPSHASGVRWDDPAFAIQWPLKPKIISQKDLSYPLFSETNS